MLDPTWNKCLKPSSANYVQRVFLECSYTMKAYSIFTWFQTASVSPPVSSPWVRSFTTWHIIHILLHYFLLRAIKLSFNWEKNFLKWSINTVAINSATRFSWLVVVVVQTCWLLFTPTVHTCWLHIVYPVSAHLLNFVYPISANLLNFVYPISTNLLNFDYPISANLLNFVYPISANLLNFVYPISANLLNFVYPSVQTCWLLHIYPNSAQQCTPAEYCWSQ